MSNPFGCNQKNLFGNKAKPNVAKVPEPVTIEVEKNQVVSATLPYGTPLAAPIRQHMHANVTVDSQRLFIYRSVNGWTNIALDSTDSAPKLTGDPITVVTTAYREFNACPHVSTVNLKWKGTDTLLSFDAIAGMESQFVPLPENTSDDSAAGGSKTDAEVLYDFAEDNQRKMVEMGTDVDECKTKLTYLVQAIDKIFKKLDQDERTPDDPTEPTTVVKNKRARK